MNTRPIRKIAAICGAAVLLSLCVRVAADEGVTNFSGKKPTKATVVRSLEKPPSKPADVRGLSVGTTMAGAGAAGASVAQPRKASFDQITFDLNSDRLTPPAKQTLDVIAEALSDPKLANDAFLIEGHTDATGSLAYNMHLSQLRAASVKRYLVENRHISAARLQVAGKGPTELMDKSHPNSGVNRRVVVKSTDL